MSETFLSVEGADMDKETTQGKREWKNAAGALRGRELDLDRIELLANALYAFSQPVPDYEPVFPPRIVRLLQRDQI